MNILLTGATGFIGQALVSELLQKRYSLTIVLRKKSNLFVDNINQIVVGDLNDDIDWLPILNNIDCIIHLAGKAHIGDIKKKSVLKEIVKVNTKSTLNLAKQAAYSGVSRFIYMSSIGVNGNQNNKQFLETDTPNPQDPYSISKYKAEQGLLNLSKKSGLEIVIIRPPLVYGKNAPGNFGRLLNWINKKYPMPLPLGAINNSRSLLALDNLVNFIILCMDHKKAANEIFLLSDGDDISTTQLLKNMLEIYNKKTLLLPVPVSLISFVSKLLGKKKYEIQLLSSLRIDSSKARDLLEWRPVVKMKDQLKL